MKASTDLVLVQGLFASGQASVPEAARRERAVAEYGQDLGVRGYEWVSGGGKRLANRFLRHARGTAATVHAVEIIELDELRARASLADEAARARWRSMFGCESRGLDTARSFILAGRSRQLVEGPARGQRVLWFGRGLSQLSEAEFVAHYIGRHGPLVAGFAAPLGLRQYRQVPDERGKFCDSLRELGLGAAPAPPVFAELVTGVPPLNWPSLRARRLASREIAADEKRHIDFSRSMLLLV